MHIFVHHPVTAIWVLLLLYMTIGGVARNTNEAILLCEGKLE